MNNQELKAILESHAKWLRGDGGERATLRDATLEDANLRYANLRYANLEGANLEDAVGNMRHIKSLQADTYPVAYTAEVMQIGCQRHTISEWWGFSDKEILAMDGKTALTWCRAWKPILQQIIEASPAEPTGYEGES